MTNSMRRSVGEEPSRIKVPATVVGPFAEVCRLDNNAVALRRPGRGSITRSGSFVRGAAHKLRVQPGRQPLSGYLNPTIRCCPCAPFALFLPLRIVSRSIHSGSAVQRASGMPTRATRSCQKRRTKRVSAWNRWRRRGQRDSRVDRSELDVVDRLRRCQPCRGRGPRAGHPAPPAKRQRLIVHSGQRARSCFPTPLPAAAGKYTKRRNRQCTLGPSAGSSPRCWPAAC